MERESEIPRKVRTRVYRKERVTSNVSEASRTERVASVERGKAARNNNVTRRWSRRHRYLLFTFIYFINALINA